MQIRTQRLSLRPLDPADAAAMSRLAGDFDVASMTGTIPHPYSESAARAWVDRVGQGEEGVVFAVTRDGKLIGCSGYMPMDADHVELGYWIGKPYWGAGYATEAVRAVIAHAFDPMASPISGPAISSTIPAPGACSASSASRPRARRPAIALRAARRFRVSPTVLSETGPRPRSSARRSETISCADACKMTAPVLIPHHAISRFSKGLRSLR